MLVAQGLPQRDPWTWGGQRRSRRGHQVSLLSWASACCPVAPPSHGCSVAFPWPVCVCCLIPRDRGRASSQPRCVSSRTLCAPGCPQCRPRPVSLPPLPVGALSFRVWKLWVRRRGRGTCGGAGASALARRDIRRRHGVVWPGHRVLSPCPARACGRYFICLLPAAQVTGSFTLSQNFRTLCRRRTKANGCVESCGGRDERTASTCRQPKPDQTKVGQSHGASRQRCARTGCLLIESVGRAFAKAFSRPRGRRQASMPAVSHAQMMSFFRSKPAIGTSGCTAIMQRCAAAKVCS